MVADRQHRRVVALEEPRAGLGRDRRLAAVEEGGPAGAVETLLGAEVEDELERVRCEIVVDAVALVVTEIGEVAERARADVDRAAALRCAGAEDIGIERMRQRDHLGADLGIEPCAGFLEELRGDQIGAHALQPSDLVAERRERDVELVADERDELAFARLKGAGERLDIEQRVGGAGVQHDDQLVRADRALHLLARLALEDVAQGDVELRRAQEAVAPVVVVRRSGRVFERKEERLQDARRRLAKRSARMATIFSALWPSP